MGKIYHRPPVLLVGVAFLAAVHFSACGTASSQVSNVGADTYNITTSAPSLRGGAVEAKRMALSEANAFCAKSGKEAFVTNVKTSKNHAEVSFRCEDEGQPKLPLP